MRKMQFVRFVRSANDFATNVRIETMTYLERILIGLEMMQVITRLQRYAIVSAVMFADEYCELSVPNHIDGETTFAESYGRNATRMIQELNQ